MGRVELLKAQLDRAQLGRGLRLGPHPNVAQAKSGFELAHAARVERTSAWRGGGGCCGGRGGGGGYAAMILPAQCGRLLGSRHEHTKQTKTH